MDNSFHVSVLFFVCMCVCVCMHMPVRVRRWVGERGTACFLLVPVISLESAAEQRCRGRVSSGGTVCTVLNNVLKTKEVQKENSLSQRNNIE